MKITTRDLAPELWSAVETLFGGNGACGGCWCQAWRIEKGEQWDDVKGDPAKQRLRDGIRSGEVLGVLAFVGEEPVGWCTYGPRPTFSKLNRAPSLKFADAEEVWAIPCFFVKRGFRKQGVATALLKHALKAMKKRKARIAEGYPSKPDKKGVYIDTFAWTGTQSLFADAGFAVAGNRDGGKQRVRKDL